MYSIIDPPFLFFSILAQKIREQAEQKYREIMESPNYLQNKQAFLTFMQTINTE